MLAADRDLVSGEELYYGLTKIAWIKIAVVSVLMATLFRFNLVRLWLKTNPISGESNWGHSVVVPLIGLYYLYIHREEMLKAKVQPVRIGDRTIARIISS